MVDWYIEMHKIIKEGFDLFRINMHLYGWYLDNYSKKNLPFKRSPNRVNNIVKLIGPEASSIIAFKSASFGTLPKIN